MANLELRNVEKAYSAVQVIRGVNLDIKDGEFIVFVGPSGCGKSTLLRMIAGLEHITSGDVLINGKVVNDLPAPKRGIAMVFQSYALYPHMSVRENMSFGLEMSGASKELIEERVSIASEILQLEPYLDRSPKALSGGQRQRVAIGRAIVREPQVFLFDEPLSNLDAALRGQTRVELARLHAQLGTTMIYVTHDQTEAMTLADRIVVLRAGQIEQVGTPLELYRSPCNAFVGGFIGGQTMNFLPVEGGKLALDNDRRSPDFPKETHVVGVRPEHLRLANSGEGQLHGKVDVVEQFGEFALYYISLDGAAPDAPLLIFKSDEHWVGNEGDTIELTLDPDHWHLFNEKGRAL
ncbi:lactose/L-arabinose transport system ATP-binding protein [Cohaesibacter sp. ES.047]|uniref:ABC transporter ATP-binding protein n=1 Tax=Cohaesibacter sp. ES.047 TaxID=1798205 RepID=UPI000BB7B4F4|nr:sn-glycerol-3-phosphate ABC transporter ATP-binding protein UgpC [Cohaesibacter sp. ES.047]SNY92212.1 lactose/L-arabinose transport system ATP-binding protein [Cohaesibacter sp. ES.047]